MTSRRVVFAPDSFKGTATAVEAAEALATGWREVRPHDELRLVPMADGGEGTLDAFEIARPEARRIPVRVTGPDDAVVEAYWLHLPDDGSAGRGVEGDAGDRDRDGGGGHGDGPERDDRFDDRAGRIGGVGVVELASTSGITLLHPLRPLEAHTLGFGQAIRAALDAGVDRLVLAIGGSSSTDGGAGLLTALGARFIGADGLDVPLGNGSLGSVVRVELGALVSVPPGGVVVLSDVTSPLLGRHGAVAVFGPQKGIGESIAPPAEERLDHFARIVRDAVRGLPSGPGRPGEPSAGAHPLPLDDLGRPEAEESTGDRHPIHRDEPGDGAAGGAGFGLRLWGAKLAPGASAVAQTLGLASIVEGAHHVVTGEGRYDHQSESGKVPSEVRRLARDAGAGVSLVAGAVEGRPELFDHALALTDLAGSPERALAEPLPWLTEAGRRLAARADAP